MTNAAVKNQRPLSLREFCKSYRVGYATAKHEIASGRIKTKRDGASEVIDREEAEKWLDKNGNRARATNALSTDKSSVIYGPEFLCLLGCSSGYTGGSDPVRAARYVERLRTYGINIEIVVGHGDNVEFRLKDYLNVHTEGKVIPVWPEWNKLHSSSAH